MNGGSIFFHCLFLNDAQDLQCRGFGITDMASAITTRAGYMTAFRQSWTQALAGHFHQAELGDLTHLNAGTVMT